MVDEGWWAMRDEAMFVVRGAYHAGRLSHPGMALGEKFASAEKHLGQAALAFCKVSLMFQHKLLSPIFDEPSRFRGSFYCPRAQSS
jgi:hypothetical protein